jgi:hypothetical protein
MENTHVYLDTSTGSEASINEQGTLTIGAHEAELGTMLGQVTLDAQETWILLQWLYGHSDMLYELTHPDQDITTKLRADNQQSKQPRGFDAEDLSERAHDDWSNDE